MILTKYRGLSFGAILDLNKGAGLGFDSLRLALAIMILLSHTSGLTGHSGITTGILNSIFHVTPDMADSLAAVTTKGAEDVPARAPRGLGRPITLAYVPMFFALSGFLVAASAIRTRQLVRFLGLRALRIVPALLVEVTLSALILGTLFTTLPLNEYFTSPKFYSYFLNIIGEVHFFLPGVFEGNHSKAVNANLWTLPYELLSYVAMSALMLSTILYRRAVITTLYLLATVVLLIANMFFGFQVTLVQLPGPVAVYYFLTGVMFYIWRDKIVYNELLFLAAGATSYVLMMFTTTVYVYFIGLSPFPQLALVKSGDYSYGIYLYGYPVTQAFVTALPSLKSDMLTLAAVSLATTMIFAAFSWHAVEKHFLKLKRYLSPQSLEITEQLHPGIRGDANEKVEARES